MHVHRTGDRESNTTDLAALPACRRRRGFSLTELLVVIGIIVLLVGLLLVALRGVRNRARQADTESVMQAFRQGCEAFQLEHRYLPGLVPESVLAQNENLMTTTENALLQLMGGARVLPPNASPNESGEYANYSGDEITLGSTSGQWRVKFDRTRLGEGPLVNGKPFAPYFTASGREIGIVEGQWHGGANTPPELPDLIDSWGSPIIYVRRLRSAGPLVGATGGSPLPQFTMAGLGGYLGSTSLGEVGSDQTGGPRRSILAGTDADINAENFARVIRHPALPDQARGGLAMISPGPDGIYLSGADGPGTQEDPVTDLQAENLPDTVLDEYDDIRIFGGG